MTPDDEPIAAPELESIEDAVDESDELEQPADPSSDTVSDVPVEEIAAPAEPVVPPSLKKWYVVKVTSGREESIKAAVERRVKIEGLEEFFGQILIPVEKIVELKKVKETKNGEKITKEKRVTKDRKKFPGYVMAEVEFNDRILYLFRETSGVGDFVGATGPMKPPPPMTEREVQQMLGGVVGPDDSKKGKIVKLEFEKGDKVRIREGAFSSMEGEVKLITEPKDTSETPKVTVEVLIFGRPVPVELDYWQVDKV